MSNKTHFLTFLKSKVAELQTVAYYFVIFQLDLFAYQKTSISVENILQAVYFPRQSGLQEKFFFQVVSTARKIELSGGSKQTSTIPFFFLKRFLKIPPPHPLLPLRTLRFYEFYITVNQPYLVIRSPLLNNYLQESAVKYNRHLNSTTYQLI